MSIIVDGTNGITVPKITSTGLVDISGASAGQIKFPAAQNTSSDANTLDDYEEGTWTPTLNFGGASVGLVYTGQVGKYTKVGNVVTVQCYISLSNKGSSSGGAYISGLPFPTKSSGTYTRCPMYINNLTSSMGAGEASYAPNASTSVTLTYMSSGTLSSAVTSAMINNTSDFMVTVSYLTD